MGLTVNETTMRGGGSSSRSEDGSRKGKRTFIVRYDATTPPASLADVETADDTVTAIPAEGSEYKTGDPRIATTISVKPRKSGLIFDVDVDYETTENELGDNPLTIPVDYDWDFSASSQPYLKDCTTPNAKMATTSAGELFQNLLERETGVIVVTVTDNIAAVAWNTQAPLAAQYMSDPSTAVNNAAMTIDGISFSENQVRFGGARCSGIRTSNGIDYRTRVIVLKLRQHWNDVVEDRGFHEGATFVSPGVPKDIKEIVKGTPPTKPEHPWPLDGSGTAKANVSDAPAQITLKPYPPRDMVVWGIT